MELIKDEKQSLAELRKLHKENLCRSRMLQRKCVKDMEERSLDIIDKTMPLKLAFSDNPYKARIQKLANIMIAACVITKFFVLAMIIGHAVTLVMAHFNKTEGIAEKMNDINIFTSGMRDFSKVPGVDNIPGNSQIMVSQFVMILVLLAVLWILRQMYALLLSVATSGNPFTRKTVNDLRKMCIPVVLLSCWNIPVAIATIIFILFLSFIFDYGVYLQKEADETETVQEKVILSFAEITEAKSGQTGQHVKRVSEYTKLLALSMGMSNEAAEKLRIASMMHDVGKLLIPSEILDKPGKLTDEEFAIIKKHTDYGEQLLANADGEIMQLSRTVAKEHHEKWDGNGYNHLKGEEISIEGRIVAVADVYDALTSKRSYKAAWAEKDAYDEIVRCSGSHFDPSVVEAFKACYPQILEVRSRYADEALKQTVA